jgi:hypothetical protein
MGGGGKGGVMTTIGTRAPAAILTGPVAWQRTGVVGTELVLPSPPATEGNAQVSGVAVVAGDDPFTLDWRAGLDEDGDVVTLAASCRGAGWTRTLDMSRTGGNWVTHPDLDPGALVRIDGSPIFLCWAMRRLRLAAEPVRIATIRVAVPSLEVTVTPMTYQLISANRLRVTGDGPAVTYELDGSGMIDSQAGRFRRVGVRAR